MKLLREFLQSIPIWICLLGLDLDFWTEEATGCVGSKIGNPIKLDQVTKGMIRISFAWVLIEIDWKISFPNQIPILDENDNLIWQPVVYEWLPDKCKNFNYDGHTETNAT